MQRQRNCKVPCKSLSIFLFLTEAQNHSSQSKFIVNLAVVALILPNSKIVDAGVSPHGTYRRLKGEAKVNSSWRRFAHIRCTFSRRALLPRKRLFSRTRADAQSGDYANQ